MGFGSMPHVYVPEWIQKLRDAIWVLPKDQPNLMLTDQELLDTEKRVQQYDKPISIIGRREVAALLSEVRWARNEYKYPVPKKRR